MSFKMFTGICIGLAVIAVILEELLERKYITKLSKDYDEVVNRYVYLQKKHEKYKKQIEYLNIFLKEMELLTQTNNYHSVKNLENSIRSSVKNVKEKLNY